MSHLPAKLLLILIIGLITPVSYADDLLSANNKAQNLNEFSFDGCSLFPEGTIKNPKLWEHCCLEHDLFYWAGGTKSQRLQADKMFRQCFKNLKLHNLAEIVYAAVRLGRFYPFQFRSQQWGNAWSKKRNYKCLTNDDYIALENQLLSYNISADLKNKVLMSVADAVSNPTKACMPQSLRQNLSCLKLTGKYSCKDWGSYSLKVTMRQNQKLTEYKFVTTKDSKTDTQSYLTDGNEHPYKNNLFNAEGVYTASCTEEMLSIESQGEVIGDEPRAHFLLESNYSKNNNKLVIDNELTVIKADGKIVKSTYETTCD